MKRIGKKHSANTISSWIYAPGDSGHYELSLATVEGEKGIGIYNCKEDRRVLKEGTPDVVRDYFNSNLEFVLTEGEIEALGSTQLEAAEIVCVDKHLTETETRLAEAEEFKAEQNKIGALREFGSRCAGAGDYIDLVKHAIRLTDVANCRFSTRGDRPESVYQREPAAHLRWYIGSQKAGWLSAGVAVAHLFHELGHMQQEDIEKGGAADTVGTLEKVQRESDAWDLGKALLADVLGDAPPTEFWTVFETEKDRCLVSYKREYESHLSETENRLTL